MTSEKENFITMDEIDVESQVQLRRDFTIPKDIKITKIIIAVVINLLIGGTMFALSIVYYSVRQDNSLYLMFFAVFMTIVGGALLAQFPFAFFKAVKSQLILGEKSIRFRNNFTWTKIPWEDIEEVLITEKLTKELDSADFIGIDLIRFRTIAKRHYFLGESYPIEDAEEIKASILEAFLIAMEGTEFTVKERSERPSIKSRLIFYNKEVKMNDLKNKRNMKH